VRVAIVGAGGVGGYYGGVMARAGHEVVMLARGPHLDALRASGIEIRTPEGTFTARVKVTDDPDEVGPATLAVVAVKSYSLLDVASTVKRLAESGAVVLPLLNGVEAVDRLVATGVPEGQIIGGLTQISAVKVGPGVVERRSPFARVILGEVGGAKS
jgi:2-dehydropantoate 2-reductase